MMKRTQFVFAVLAAVILANHHVHAQSWTGSTNGNWATASNWSSLPATNGNASLFFGASSNTTMNQNLANPLNVNQLTFNAGAPAYTLSGNTIGIDNSSGGANGTITQNSSNAVTISAPLNANAPPLIIAGTGSGTLTLSGVFSGDLLNQSSGNLVLSNSANSLLGAEIATGTLIITSPTAASAASGQNAVQIDPGAVFQLGFPTGGNSTAPLGMLNNNGGTFAVPTGNADYYLYQMNTNGTVDFTGSTNFWLHFAGATPTINVSPSNAANGASTWIGSGSSRIQDDGTAPLLFNLLAGYGNFPLTEGIILANGSTSQPIDFTSTNTDSPGTPVPAGTVILTNPNNTANFIVDTGIKLQVASLSDLGTGTLTLRYTVSLGSGMQTAGAIVYTGPTATLTKNITVGNSFGSIDGAGAIGVTQNGTTLTVSGVISEASPQQGLGIFGSGTSASTGIVSLTGTNTYTGQTFVFGGGILSISTVTNSGVAGPLGAATNDPFFLMLGMQNYGPGTLLYTGVSASTDRGITFSGTTADAGYVNVATAGTNLTVSGPMTGGILNKTGPGTLTLVNNGSTFSVANVLAGTLAITNASGMGAGGSTVNVMANSTFQLGFSFGANPNSPLATLNLNGGTMTGVSGNGGFYLNQIVSQAGGAIDLSATSNLAIYLMDFSPSSTAAINVTANATWLGGGSSRIVNNRSTLLPITISPGVTLTDGVILAPGNAPVGFQVTGGGTLNLTGAPIAPMTVSAGSTLQTAAVANLQGIPTLTLDGGTLAYAGPSGALTTPITLTANGGTVSVSSPSATLQVVESLTGTSLFDKEGQGTLALVSAYSFTGTMLVDTGVLQLQSGLGGTAAIAVNGAGTLQFAAAQITGRTFNLNYGTLTAAAGVPVTLNGATINGGFMRGPGTFSLTGGTALNGVTAENSAAINQTESASLANVSNGGSLTIAAGLTSNMIGVINQGSGSITLGAGSTVNAADFQSYGTMNLTPASGSNFTTLANTGSSALFFNGGSQTFIGTASAPNPNVVGVDLGGQNLMLAGALFVNNGLMYSSVNGGSIIVGYGATFKGAGSTDVPIVTQNGGKVVFGNCPGVATFGSLVVGSGGINNLEWEINDAGPSATHPLAPGVAGPNSVPMVSGWSLGQVTSQTLHGIQTNGDLSWTATPTAKFDLELETLAGPATPVGTTLDGLMADFDPTQSYSWPIITYQGTFSGPTSDAGLTADTLFDTSLFANAIAAGSSFGLHLDQYPTGGGELDLVYTPNPVPEPGTLLLVGSALALGWTTRRRAGRRSSSLLDGQ